MEKRVSRVKAACLCLDLRASPAGRCKRPPRVRTRPRGQENGENTPQRADANGQTRSDRSIPGPNVGERWVNMDKRAVRARVRTCLLVSGVGPPGSRTVSTRLLHRGYWPLHRRFGLVPHVVSLEVMPPLAVCAGLQCRVLGDRAGR
jgi:hypothetical protein